MVDLVKQDMTHLWAQTGDILSPDSAKIDEGWAVEAVPRQWWNWMQNRVDTNVAYMLQKGFPEWDGLTEYIINKSYVQHMGVIYKCIQTGTNQNPSTATAYWVKAFPESSASLEAIEAVTPAANTLAYFTDATTAATTSITAFARSILDDVDAAAVRTTIGAQQANTALTALSGTTPATNALPYFTGTTTAGTTTLSAFGRTLIDDADAATARATLGVTSTTDLNTALAGKQPIDATLTALAGLATGVDQLPYFTGADTVAQTTLSAYGRSLIDDADAATARTTLGLGTIATQNSATVSITGGSITGITDLAIADGGTGSSTAAGARSNLGLGNVDNTSDANKPISTATQAALNLKVSKDSDVGIALLPTGTTANRPASPVVGGVRFNTTLNQYEGYSSSGWGQLGGGATGAPGNAVFNLNDQNVTGDFTIPTGKNAMTAGPVTVNDGVTVTISDGCVWTIV